MTTAATRRAAARAAGDALAWTLLVLALAPTLAGVARIWREPIAEHGPLVVAAAGWLVWRARGRLRAAPRAPRPLVGGLVLVAALWLRHAAALEPHLTVTAPLLLVAAAGLVLALHGAAVLRVVAFPLALLLFALPAPGPMLFSLSVRLQLLSASLAQSALEAVGVAVVRVGSTLHVPGATVVVDEGCSGLRGLMAIVAFAVLMAHLATDRRRGAAALVVAVPGAVVANALRVVVMTWLVARGHTWVLEGAAHELTGLAVYAVAIGLVLGVSGRLGRQETAPGAPADDPPTAGEAGAEGPHRSADLPVAPRLALLLVLAAFAVLALSEARDGPTEVARRLPERLGPFTGPPAELRPIVFELLGDDVAARRYVVDDPTAPVDVVVVHSADPWRAFHPPDDCFLIGGWSPVAAGEAHLAGQPARRRLFRRGAAGQLVYYWVRVGTIEAVDALDLRLALFLGRLRGGRRFEATLVRMSTSVESGDVAAAERRLQAFAAETLAPLGAALSANPRH